jgi:hypothetical protein
MRETPITKQDDRINVLVGCDAILFNNLCNLFYFVIAWHFQGFSLPVLKKAVRA